MNTTLQSRNLISNKFGERMILGGAAVGSAAIIGLSGVTFAMPKTGTPPNVTLCRTQYMKYGFKNKGQCVSWWNKHHGGFGYGGDHDHDGDDHGNHSHHHHGFFGDVYHYFF